MPDGGKVAGGEMVAGGHMVANASILAGLNDSRWFHAAKSPDLRLPFPFLRDSDCRRLL